ncbi:electron transport complex subunit RsxG [Thalassomonas actiniarum]|uniref:Ion-translocating oxidoreductase complex subunit G n=1 Tax=Thalassomonas actiniarum TaxID=485447 RepID=A0AAF0BYW9_9GAMM|nr:electron transport complex subunit RsxG [Thalassomonas actiniarum]WDD97641.1 electron transport complex subunit RsxG [Thalassomonas actiniarum]
MRIAIKKNSKILALFAIACTAVVGLVNEFTKGHIQNQQQQHLLTILHSIIEPQRLNNNLANDCRLVTDPLLGSTEPQTVYLARYDGEPVAAAIRTTAPDGYNGNIELIVAVNADGSVSGVRQLKHNETPGLGDKIEIRKSDWITGFNGKKMRDEKDSRWAVTKDNGMFDQFTGATITPRAVVKAVKQTVTYFKQHQQALFALEAGGFTGTCRDEGQSHSLSKNNNQNSDTNGEES